MQIKISIFRNNVIRFPAGTGALLWTAVPVGIIFHARFSAWAGLTYGSTFTTWAMLQHVMRLW